MNTSTKPIIGKVSWPFGTSVKQNFLLPSTVMYYILTNPLTPKYYFKIIQQCKYFFEKNPILVVARIEEEKSICSNEEFQCNKYEGGRPLGHCCVKFDIAKIKSKIWLTNKLSYVYNTNVSHDFVVKLQQKIYRCESAQLLFHDTKINFDDFQSLAAYFKIFCLMDAKIRYEDGSLVMLDKIVEAIPAVEKFEYWFEDNSIAATPSSLNNICKLKNLKNLKTFDLYGIPEIFNFQALSSLIKNFHKSTKILLDFNERISEEYKNQLDLLIDEILHDQIFDCMITYEEQNQEKYEILEERCGI